MIYDEGATGDAMRILIQTINCLPLLPQHGIGNHLLTLKPIQREHHSPSGRLTSESNIIHRPQPQQRSEETMKYRTATLTVLLLSAFLSALPATAQIYLSGPQSDTLDAGEYIVEDDIWVEWETLWYLRPGVVLRFYEDTQCYNHGALYAMGEEGDSIRFEAYDPDLPWEGIDYRVSGYFCYMNYTVVTGSNETGVYVEDFAAVDIAHSRFSHNSAEEEDQGAGIQSRSGGGQDLLEVTISDNEGIGYYADAGGELRDCTIKGNTGTGLSGYAAHLNVIGCTFRENMNSAVNAFQCTITMDSCEFRENHAVRGGAIYVAGPYGVAHSLFIDNVAEIAGGAIYQEGDAPFDITNCNLYENQADSVGSAIYGHYMFVANCNIMNNYDASEAVYVEDGMEFLIANTLFYANQGDDVYEATPMWPFGEFGILDSTNVNGDSCDYWGNLFMDPLFVDIENEDFHLQPSSPCIDAGWPYAPLDPDSTLSDIGMHYFDQSNAVRDRRRRLRPSEFEFSSVYPNPFNSSVTLSVSVPGNGDFNLSIYSILGQQLQTETLQLQAGHHSIVWTAPPSLAAGTYFIQIGNTQESGIKKVILLR
jgi:hypothetical protein